MHVHAELAQQIVDTCLQVQAGETVWVQSWDHTIDLAADVALTCRQRGAYPMITLVPEAYWTRSLQEVPRQLLEVLPSQEAAAFAQTNVFIFMLGPRRPIEWAAIPAAKQNLADVWYSGTNPYVARWRTIARDHTIRILGIEHGLVTPERADTLGVPYEAWRDVMLAGCVANQADIAHTAGRLATRLRDGREVQVQTPAGTNLHFTLTGRQPIVGDSIVTKKDAAEGRVKFLPSGFVEVAADETSAEGTVVYDVPIPVRGAQISGLTLRFQRGEVVAYSAEAGMTAFESYLQAARGDGKRLGFFGLGLNSGLRHGFTQDDKVLGGVTIGIGGNADKGGANTTPDNEHWWASMTHATVWIDGVRVLTNGALCPVRGEQGGTV